VEPWTKLLRFEPTWTGLFVLIGVFAATLWLRRLLPEDRRHRGRLSLLFLGVGPVLHLVASGLDLLGLRTVAATLHLLTLFLLLAGVTGATTLVVFDLALGRTPIPTLVRDLVQTTLFGSLALAILYSAGLDPLSVVTTSAVVTAVLGLALQSVIANTFAGVVLQVERSLALGDWIAIGDRVGRITEIRWRSSTLVTQEGDTALIPNLQLLANEVLNLSRPTRSRRVQVRVPFHHRHSPGEVRDALIPVIRDVPGVLQSPPPTCLPVEFDEREIVHAVAFWVEDLAEERAIEGEVRQRIWYAAERAGLEGPCPPVPTVPEPGEAGTPGQRAELSRRLRALGRVALFQALAPGDREALARGVRRRRFTRGEVVIRQGEPGRSLFVVDQGSVRVGLDGGGSLATLGPGDFFGEMSLLTGEPRQATCVAERETTCDELDREALLPLFAAKPDLAEAIARDLARRQLALEERREELSAASEVQALSTRSETLFRRVRAYFHLG
jgi:small-conductance mechanosensitive channel/CRP-like cAMP-binding protein